VEQHAHSIPQVLEDMALPAACPRNSLLDYLDSEEKFLNL